MKRKYIYIESGTILDETARIYFVMVGNGKQATKDYLRLIAYAAEHGHYFELYSQSVADFLLRVQKSVPTLQRPVLTDARQFVRDLKKGSRPTLSDTQLMNIHHALPYLNINYRKSPLAKRGHV